MLPIPQCDICIRQTKSGYCQAFGDIRIPDEIAFSEFDHTKPYPGDNGLMFLPKNPNCAEMQKRIFEPEEEDPADAGKLPLE